MDLRVINKRIIFQRMRKKRSKTLLSFFIQQQNWTGIQDANLTSVEFLIHRELPHYQLLCWVKWSSHLIRTCKLSYVPDWLYKWLESLKLSLRCSSQSSATRARKVTADFATRAVKDVTIRNLIPSHSRKLKLGKSSPYIAS